MIVAVVASLDKKLGYWPDNLGVKPLRPGMVEETEQHQRQHSEVVCEKQESRGRFLEVMLI